MVKLPEKGDVKRAADTLDARVTALSNNGVVEVGPIHVHTDHVEGGRADLLHSAYGDLFNVSELLNEAGFPLIVASVVAMADGADVKSEMSTVFLQATALGVLMERARWQS